MPATAITVRATAGIFYVHPAGAVSSASSPPFLVSAAVVANGVLRWVLRMTPITPTPMPTTLALVSAASSPIQFPAPANDLDFGAAVLGTGTSTGTTALTVSGVSPHTLVIGSLVSGTGVPANTRLTGQTSGQPGGSGVYTTNNPTTLTAVALTFTPSRVISPGGNTLPIVVNPATHIPGEPLSKTAGNFPYTLALPTFAFMPLVQGVKFNLSAHPPWKTAGVAEPVTPPPLLTMTRTPPFPAYPS